jgi:ABC-2 type transport system ATP-binding protein
MEQELSEESVIEVEKLMRVYHTKKGWIKRKKVTVTAVNDLSFFIQRGEVFGLLGENGAGKTTTIKMLITLLAPTSGSCKVLGFNTYGEEKKIRNRINFIFGGEMGVYRRLSARDNLRYFSNIYLIPTKTRESRITELLELVGLTESADLLVETYSKGMIQRLQIARGLINNPEIIFMDEPTVGLDPVGARMLRDIIRKLKEQGKTVLLTTHYMYEADELCDRIAIMKKGKIIALDSPRELKRKYRNHNDEQEITLEDVYISLVEGAAV